MSENIQERWAYGSALHVENPTVGTFKCEGIKTCVELVPDQHNWLVCSVPAPNVLEGWRVKAVMILYNIRNPRQQNFGKIDKIGVRDGHQDVHRFENLDIGLNTTWEVRKLELPTPRAFRFGLGVTIHLNCPPIFDTVFDPQMLFCFTSVGLEFIKSTEGPIVNPNP